MSWRRHLKHWLVPHKHNDHRPHLIRAHGLAIVAVLIVGLQTTALAVRPAAARPPGHQSIGAVLAYATDITPQELFDQTNQQRAANGLPPLQLDSRLNASASAKAADMFQYDYWAHVNPVNGTQPWYWFTQAGYSYSYAGENLAKDFDTTAGVMTGWMNSPGHRANILNPHYVDVGFAVQNGVLVGGQTTLVVAHYGAPASAAIAAATPVPSARPQAQPIAATAGEPTATPTPAVSATPSPVPTVAPVAPIVKGQISAGPSAPEPHSYSLFAPLSLTKTLNWPSLISLGLLLLLFSIYFVTHLAVWRKGLKRWRSPHYKAYAVASLAVLGLAIILLATSGFGMVG